MSARLVRCCETSVPAWTRWGLQGADFTRLRRSAPRAYSGSLNPYNEDDSKSWEHISPAFAGQSGVREHVIQPESRGRRSSEGESPYRIRILPTNRFEELFVEHAKPWNLPDRENRGETALRGDNGQTNALLEQGAILLQELWRPGRDDLDFEPVNGLSDTPREPSGLVLEALKKEATSNWTNALCGRDQPVLYEPVQDLTYQERSVLNDFGHEFTKGAGDSDFLWPPVPFFLHKASSNFLSADPPDMIYVTPETPSWWIDIPIATRHSEVFKSGWYQVLSPVVNRETFRPMKVTDTPSIVGRYTDFRLLEPPSGQDLITRKVPRSNPFKKASVYRNLKQYKLQTVRAGDDLSSPRKIRMESIAASDSFVRKLTESVRGPLSEKRFKLTKDLPPGKAQRTKTQDMTMDTRWQSSLNERSEKDVARPVRIRINREQPRPIRPMSGIAHPSSLGINAGKSDPSGTKRHKSTLAPAAGVSTGTVGKPFKTKVDVEAFIRRPSWDISSLIGTSEETEHAPKERVTTGEVHHLLRLSALRVEDAATTEKQQQTLERQLNFVKAVQSIDTTGIEPLVAIRDETAAAWKESEITLEKMQSVLDKEEQVGRYRRIIPKANPAAEEAEREIRATEARERDGSDWDPLSQAASKVGRYIKVNTKKS